MEMLVDLGLNYGPRLFVRKRRERKDKGKHKKNRVGIRRVGAQRRVEGGL